MTNPVRSLLAIFGGLVLLRLLDGVLIVAHPISAALVGFVIGKIARAQEIRRAAAAAAIQTAVYAWVFASEPAVLPAWVHVMLLVTTAPAMLLGASTRAKARAVETPAPAGGPEEHS